MLDHVIITVGDYQRSKEFYEKALKPLGYGLMEFESGSGGAFGPEGKPVFADPARRAARRPRCVQ